jgi:hypothetical protein
MNSLAHVEFLALECVHQFSASFPRDFFYLFLSDKISSLISSPSNETKTRG